MSRKLQKAAFHACFSPVVKAFHDAWHEDAILRLITLIKLECIQSLKRGNRNLNNTLRIGAISGCFHVEPWVTTAVNEHP